MHNIYIYIYIYIYMYICIYVVMCAYMCMVSGALFADAEAWISCLLASAFGATAWGAQRIHYIIL